MIQLDGRETKLLRTQTFRPAIVLLLGLGLIGLPQLHATERTQLAAEKPLTKETIPADVLTEAKRRGIRPQNIHRQGEHWIGCEDETPNSSCVVLGSVHQIVAKQPLKPAQTIHSLNRQDVLEIYQYGRAVRIVPVQGRGVSRSLADIGQFVRSRDGQVGFELHANVEARVVVQGKPQQTVDSIPHHRRESPQVVRTRDVGLVRQYLDTHPNEPFIVLVTVPAHCAPCRELDHVLAHAPINRSPFVAASASGSRTESPMKLFILEYFSFAEAEREVLGAGAIFPTTLFFEPATTKPRASAARFIGNLKGASIESISVPLRQRFHRGAPHTIVRGAMSRDMLLSLAK